MLWLREPRMGQPRETLRGAEGTLRMSGRGFSITCVWLNRWKRASLTKHSRSV